MKILNETKNKETIPVAFLTDFISKGWEEVGYLKADIEAIKEAYKGTSKIEELIQNLIDAYLVCIGQLELHIHDKKYLEYPEESGLSGIKLDEELELKVSSNKIEIKTEENTPVDVVEEEDKIIIGIDEVDDEDSESEDELDAEEVSAKDSIEINGSEPFEYFVDFDEPNIAEPRLTDEDIYG